MTSDEKIREERMKEHDVRLYDTVYIMYAKTVVDPTDTTKKTRCVVVGINKYTITLEFKNWRQSFVWRDFDAMLVDKNGYPYKPR